MHRQKSAEAILGSAGIKGPCQATPVLGAVVRRSTHGAIKKTTAAWLPQPRIFHLDPTNALPSLAQVEDRCANRKPGSVRGCAVMGIPNASAHLVRV
jgi:hypothetical protein